MLKNAQTGPLVLARHIISKMAPDMHSKYLKISIVLSLFIHLCFFYLERKELNNEIKQDKNIEVYLVKRATNDEVNIYVNENNNISEVDNLNKNIIIKNNKHNGKSVTKSSEEGPTEVVSSRNNEDNNYYRSNEVDEIPQIIGNPDIDLIDGNLFTRDEILIFDIYINKQGRIEKIEIIKSNISEINIQKILNSFYKVKFTPGFKNGDFVNYIKRIEIKTEYIK
ncbi:hypothetical protein SAMN05660284_01620 [Formivibrio citricus]|uniref:Uncharacterized protein n=1 Tax=Formivibrio citricus TaxID=83765 RepID=A0A1I4ZGK5_9NEIS|nr:hypothetical protein [Formivibrio citricus]SFN49109.1 hypothetical protein SAMN05660284_01620 [Formivibrio citricus]